MKQRLAKIRASLIKERVDQVWEPLKGIFLELEHSVGIKKLQECREQWQNAQKSGLSIVERNQIKKEVIDHIGKLTEEAEELFISANPLEDQKDAISPLDVEREKGRQSRLNTSLNRVLAFVFGAVLLVIGFLCSKEETFHYEIELISVDENPIPFNWKENNGKIAISFAGKSTTFPIKSNPFEYQALSPIGNNDVTIKLTGFPNYQLCDSIHRLYIDNLNRLRVCKSVESGLSEKPISFDENPIPEIKPVKDNTSQKETIRGKDAPKEDPENDLPPIEYNRMEILCDNIGKIFIDGNQKLFTKGNPGTYYVEVPVNAVFELKILEKDEAVIIDEKFEVQKNSEVFFDCGSLSITEINKQ